MKTMLISEDEKNRILEMHKEATKKHYLGEQASNRFGGAEGENDKQSIFTKLVTQINNKFGNTTSILQEAKNLADAKNINGAIAKLQSLPEDIMMKLNLFDVPSKSQWKDYNSILFNMQVRGNQQQVIDYMLADMVGLKKGLTELSAEKSGFRQPNYEQFSNWKVGDVKTFLTKINSQLGLS